jgi:hypothetical protein
MSIVLLKKLIIEMSRYKKETGKSSWGAEDLKKYLSDTSQDAKNFQQYAFTMTSINKVGVNPQSEYETPLGVYFYPLTDKMYESLIDNNLPFASESENVSLVRLKDVQSSKWLRVTDKNQSIDLEKLQMKAYKFFDDSNKNFDDSNKNFDDNENLDFDDTIARWDRWIKRESRLTNASLLFAYCVFLVQKFDKKSKHASSAIRGRRFNQILRHLGFIGVYDTGEGIIHPNEPAQLVALEPSAYEIVASYNTKEIRKDSNLDSSALKEKILDNIYHIEDEVFVRYKSAEQIDAKMNFLAQKLLNNDQLLDYHLKRLVYASSLFSRGLFAIIAIIEDDILTEKFLNAWEIWAKNTEFLRFAYELRDIDVHPSINTQLKKLIKKTIAKLKSVKSSNGKDPMNFSDDYHIKRFIAYFEDAL